MAIFTITFDTSRIKANTEAPLPEKYGALTDTSKANV